MIKPFPKPLLRPKSKWLPRSHKMTIALGLLAQNSLVIGSDTQETYGVQKISSGKIYSAGRGGADRQPGSICISGAGEGPYLDASSQELIEEFQNFSGTIDEWEEVLKENVKKFYKTHVMPFIGPVSSDEVPRFSLLVGVRHDKEFRLWTTHETVIVRHHVFAVVGIAKASSSALVNQLYKPFPSLNIATLLTAYVIRQAKLTTDGVGLDTEIRFIHGDYSGVVPEETVKTWEGVFEKYQHLQKELFAYITGFTPLEIRMPGVVVPKEKRFHEVLLELGKMRKELLAHPVIKGLDEPSMRKVSPPSTSGKSEPEP